MTDKGDMIGKRFGRWCVQSHAGSMKRSGNYWVCICECGKKSTLPTRALNSGHTKSCGCLRKDLGKLNVGEKAPNWKGSKTLCSDGYIAMRYPTTGKRCYEHVFVMEQHLKRKLLPYENVHHKNGVRNDNRLENLELWSRSQPAGQRVSDKIDWAIHILQTYQPSRLV